MSDLVQLSELEEVLTSNCKILTDPNDLNFAEYLKRWTDINLKTPGAIVLPTSETDCQNISTIGSDGIIIDLSLYKGIEVYVESGTAIIKGSIFSKEVAVDHVEAEFFTTLGNGNTVGAIPYFLGGGCSITSSITGFGSEQVISARVITADGELINVTDDTNPDLLHAIRGAGQHFGLITQLVIKIHPLKNLGNDESVIWVGSFVFPLDRARGVTSVMKKLMDNDQYTTAGLMMIMPSPPARDPCLVIAARYTGRPNDAALAFKDIYDLLPESNAWIMHFHISWHTSEGLVVQIMERESDLVDLLDGDLLNSTCADWNSYASADSVIQHESNTLSQKDISDTAPVKGEIGLTFGLELEFIFATVDADKPDPHPKDPREVDSEKFPDKEAINRDILKKLTIVGIPAVITSNDMTDEEPAENKSKIYHRNGMEITSPPYYYTEPARNAIREVLRTVRGNYRVCVDETAGLHVHVAIAYTYEPQTKLIFSPDRVSGDWCPPFSTGRFCMANPDLTRVEVLEKILGYTDNESLIEDFGESSMTSPLAFNLEGLKTPYQDGIRTVEFRHHHGSLDPGAILNRIHVCIKFVKKACFAKHDELLAQLRQDVAKPIGFGEGHLSTIDFFIWLGCPAQAYYYCANMVTDKDAFEQRIKIDAARREELLRWARARLINLAKDAEKDKGKGSSKESEPTTSKSESADDNEADQNEGNDESGNSGENSSNSNENES
ncbi:hypothetical protein BHYA_0365g00060 [Botrytis hyacinthi]|uniref:FAD-binding PCMH-type domain-containing protein n=1 Tax=Botrytis hyacinthi TaxID=278943 RepID=A0A4Z1G4U5_9HELO|nr:hypothetical protein BHYA_0365g00060 [Botrytis hyacinthi]